MSAEQEPIEPTHTCDFCEQLISGPFAVLDYPGGRADLCSWACVTAFGLKHNHDLMNHYRREITRLKEELGAAKDDAYLLEFYRAGVL